MKNQDYKNMKAGDIVTNDFRTAAVFTNAGIDYCFGPNVSLSQACLDKNIDISAIEQKLIEISLLESDQNFNYEAWSLDVLCDHIVNTHHKTVKELLPQLSLYTQKIADVHGDNHGELHEIADLFKKVNSELTAHVINEEEVLFPALKDVLFNNSSDSKVISMREVMRMKTEHEFAGTVLDVIRDLTMNFTVPPDGCSTWQLTYKLMKEFADDLQMHVHIENNVLYPKALELVNFASQ